MFNYSYGRRLDKIDYENCGATNNWCFNDTIVLLTSFEMEIKKYYERHDVKDVYSRLYDRYDHYLWNCLFSDAIKYNDGLSEEDRYCYSSENTKGIDLNRANFDQDELLNYIANNNRIKVDIDNLKRFLIGEDVPELEGVASINIDIDPIKKPIAKVSKDVETPTESFYEDIISDETILKLKELPLPQLKQQVAMLAAEKKKWDTSIMVAAKIGILYCERGLHKPTEDQFLSEYKEQKDNFPPLHDTTLKRIYKNLPDGYRFSREGGRVAATSDQVDLTPIIKAAVYAGSIYDTDDAKKLSKLKAELAINKYDMPSDDVLLKIIEAVKDL